MNLTYKTNREVRDVALLWMCMCVCHI